MRVDRKGMVVAAIQHRETPLCPYTLYFNPVVEGPEVEEQLTRHYGGEGWRKRFRSYIAPCVGASDGKFVIGANGLSTDVYGCVWRMNQRPFHLESPALRAPSLRDFRLPDPDRLFPGAWEAAARVALKENADCFCVGTIGFGLFERSWALRGFSETLMDMAAEPAFYADLVEALTEHQLQLLDRLLELPIDGVWLSDDWGAQQGVIMGPERWRETLKPHVARLYRRVKAAGKHVLTHCCGSIVEIIPDLIDIGLDVLESVQPEAHGMNPYELKDRFGERLTFWGGLGSQSIIPHGTPEELRREIRHLAAHMRKGGGYILSCAKPLQPGTPTANAVAILEEFTALGEP